MPAQASKQAKRILNIEIKRMDDESPDTSWLGEYSNTRKDESDIMHEQGNFWVLSRPAAYTVFEARGVASYSVQSFAKTADGLSLAIAYCDYKGRRKEQKAKSLTAQPKH